MSFSVRTKVEVTGDKDMLKEASNTLRNRGKVLMTRVLDAGLYASARRLNAQQAARHDTIATGNLAASLSRTAGPGKGNIFEVTDYFGSAGSNLTYAAQRHFGGIILPREAKALAIPLIDRLKRQQLSPKDLDPDRILLDFVPAKAPGNIIGYLVNPVIEPEKRSKTGKLTRKAKASVAGLPPGPLYAIAQWVKQEPNRYLYWDEATLREVREVIWRDWLAGK